jgi:quercetin dioxygenase-like cupin family protein
MLSFLSLFLAAAIQVTSPVWSAAPPSMPKGAQMAVLEGDPKGPGIFTIRVKLPAGATLAPHTHPRPERVTVLSGKVTVYFSGRATTFTTGGFYVNPPDLMHSIAFEEETVLQLTCEGPWEVRYVE